MCGLPRTWRKRWGRYEGPKFPQDHSRRPDPLAHTQQGAVIVLARLRGARWTTRGAGTWDAQEPGSTFRWYYGAYEDLARRYGLTPEDKPFKYDLSETRRWLGYTPRYSLMDALRSRRPPASVWLISINARYREGDVLRGCSRLCPYIAAEAV